MQPKHKNRLIITMVFLLFAIPVGIAYLMASGAINYHPDETKNNGVFISPPVKLADFSKADWVADLPDKWTLIYRTDVVCDNSCFEWEDKLHRFNLTLGQNADKLSLMLMANDFQMRESDPYTYIKKVATKDNPALKKLFNDLSSNSLGGGEGLYVVAPEGYIMMAFTTDNSPSDIIKDLKLLVKRKG